MYLGGMLASGIYLWRLWYACMHNIVLWCGLLSLAFLGAGLGKTSQWIGLPAMKISSPPPLISTLLATSYMHACITHTLLPYLSPWRHNAARLHYKSTASMRVIWKLYLTDQEQERIHLAWRLVLHSSRTKKYSSTLFGRESIIIPPSSK